MLPSFLWFKGDRETMTTSRQYYISVTKSNSTLIISSKQKKEWLSYCSSDSAVFCVFSYFFQEEVRFSTILLSFLIISLFSIPVFSLSDMNALHCVWLNIKRAGCTQKIWFCSLYSCRDWFWYWLYPSWVISFFSIIILKSVGLLILLHAHCVMMFRAWPRRTNWWLVC